ncbi:hypothetical protein WNY58_00485 [Neptuniibacter pectenicola]|jgi:hypothetical protein|uniref:Uncharacterized protein n=1 Tax=Neptuniibacter pectenicola TaxID=1806669 RepID=A0ABU9TMB1_9GAMM|nr:hypothetical protein [Neptuniibacter pectenicola]
MTYLYRLLLSCLLLTTSSYLAADEDTDPLTEQLQQWLFQLPALVDEKGKISSSYMKNYLQCMDDQQALNQEPDMTIGELIDNALNSGNECAPLLNEMLESLTDQPVDSLSEEQKKRLLEESL